MGSHHHHRHDHSHDHGHHHHIPTGARNIMMAFILNFSFCIIELIGGLYTNSMAIISDALHDLGDSMALLFAYWGEKTSLRAPNKTFTYGHRRYSIMAALVNGLILMIGSLYVIKEAVERMQAPEPVKPDIMVLMALLGIAVNGYAAYRLSKEEGMNQKMVMFHLLEDLLGWVGVLVVSIILIFWPIYILDSILSVIISLIVLRGVYKNMRKIILILLQRFPDELSMHEIEKELSAIPNVLGVHGIRGWSIDESSYSLTIHVLVAEEMRMKEVDLLRDRINEYLISKNIHYTNIQFESNQHFCSPSIT